MFTGSTKIQRKQPADLSFLNTALEVCINISYAKTKCFTDVNGLVLVTSLIQRKLYLDSKMSKDQNAKCIYANTCNAHLTMNTFALNLINPNHAIVLGCKQKTSNQQPKHLHQASNVSYQLKLTFLSLSKAFERTLRAFEDEH